MANKLTQTTDITCTRIEDKVVLLGKDGKELITLNSTAAFIWELCNGEMTEQEITATLYEQFSADYAQISQDVKRTISHLTDMGLLTVITSE